MRRRLNRVVLLRDAPREGVWEGAVGTVVRQDEERLEVEFAVRGEATVTLSLEPWEVRSLLAARLFKLGTVGIVAGLFVLWLAIPTMVSAEAYYRVYYTAIIGVVSLAVIGLIARLLWGPLHALRRRRKIRRNQAQIDPSLRAYVASDLSWENAAMVPDFVTRALPPFRFLVDDEGFEPALLDPEAQLLHFRRGELAVNVGAMWGPEGVEEGVHLALFHTAGSYRPVAERVLGSVSDALGDGYRGVAFFLQTNLDQIADELRAEAASAQPEYLSGRSR